ncbi:beta-glucuronosyltransferase GlcAT14A-like [Curcuma longa]|uniref:beta-glucuronosyltransferase GlcAT14A-like n=1 Tax=Curcuma longa TaxID=136217 RepID=UPI003D9E8260
MAIKSFMVSFIIASLLLSLFLISKSATYFHKSDHVRRPRKSDPVTFAYLISASSGDVARLERLLLAIYNPGNRYLLHLDLGAPPAEHAQLADFVAKSEAFSRFRNVWIVGKSNLVTYRGPTMLSTTLHAMAILLRLGHWDWFVNLSAADYPLITQDDLIVAFSTLPRDLNFIQHTSHLGWKIKKRVKPIIIDPALYSHNKSDISWSANQRGLPTAFKLYTGSAWTILSRSFAEYCILSWDNLPRNLLLYYTNFISSPEGYFQTVICNSKDFRDTAVNHDLHYIVWDNPPKQHPLSLGLKDYRRMILSSVPFARKFKRSDPVLDKIDRELLRRRKGEFSKGGWCLDGNRGGCSGPIDGRTSSGVLRPGAGSRRLKALLAKLVSTRKGNAGKFC